jgi:hypothetical protein
MIGINTANLKSYRTQVVTSNTTSNNTTKTPTTVVTATNVTIKPSKKIKKADYNIYEFLVDAHGKELVTTVNIPSNNNWHHVVRLEEVASESGLLILVNSKNVVLYIGQTNYIAEYVNGLAKTIPNLNPTTVYIVAHANASKFVYAVTAYRSKFKPTYNDNSRNNRFMFSNKATTLNVTDSNMSSLEWIKANPKASYTQFVTAYSKAELRRLSRLFGLKKFSYALLRTKILNTK